LKTSRLGLPTRLALLALLAAGCTVVVPDLHVTTVAVQEPLGSGPSLAPISPLPSPSPLPSAALARRSFSGSGPVAQLGPIQLPQGRISLHVAFVATATTEGRFRLQLDDQEGMVVNALLDRTGSFDQVLQPQVEIADSYYLAIPDADGSWTVDVDPGG
jgi:hypothetical protein